MGKFDELREAYGKACEESNQTRQLCREVLAALKRVIVTQWEIPTGAVTNVKQPEVDGLDWSGAFFENRKEGTHGVAFMLHIEPPEGSPSASANVPLQLAIRVNATRKGDTVVLTSQAAEDETVVRGKNDTDAIKKFADKLFESVMEHLSGLPTGAS